MNFLNSALALAAKGYAVFPCVPREKRPLTPNGFNDATTDESIIRQMWAENPDANIGLPLKKSNLLVLDLDRHPGKEDGVATFEQMKQGHRFEQRPPRSNTGGNGIQLFFLCPDEPVKKKFPGIDVKTDGYVIVPPSIHPSGKSYAWAEGRSLTEYNPMPCPEWLLDQLRKETAPTSVKGKKPKKAEKALSEEYPPASGELIIERCAFMRHCIEQADVLAEPDWYHGPVGILSYTVEAPGIVHQASSNYPYYDAAETDRKIAHWKEDAQGPATCKAIQEKCGEQYCRACPYNGSIKSPIVLGYAGRQLDKTQQIAPFPLEVLPGVFHNFAVAAAQSLQCPVDYIACALLVAAALLIGGKRRIHLEGEWHQGNNLWVALVGTPSSKKSPALQMAFKTIRSLEQVLHAEYRQKLEVYETQMLMYEAELKEWQKNKTDNKVPVKPEKPVLDRLTTSDTTVEALGELLATNPAGIGLVVDELSAWMRSMNQYKGGRGADRSHYLSIWSNAQITIDRKNKEPIIVPEPSLSIIGTIQPDVLLELSNGGTEDGMKERFLYSCPLPNQELPTISSKIPTSLNEAIQNVLEGLWKARPEEVVMLTLSLEAKVTFVEARQEWHHIMKDADFPPEMEACYVKMNNYLGRLALILHEMKRAIYGDYPDEVTGETMQEAKALADYFLNHARLALKILRRNPEEQRVAKVMQWAKKKEKQILSPRDVVTNRVAHCAKVSEARELLRSSSDYGYGFWNEETDRLIVF